MGRRLDARSSLASLSPGLLARKGGARPAMRQQLFLENEALDAGVMPADCDNDRRWNDFGPAADNPRVITFAARCAVARANGAKARKTAFTLRLDSERHRKLRMACALDARSAQALVTDALDRLLATRPELEALARSATLIAPGKPPRGKH